jgi:hypothetical protein
MGTVGIDCREFPSGKVGRRPRNVALFAVVNAIFYVLCVRVASRRERHFEF